MALTAQPAFTRPEIRELILHFLAVRPAGTEKLAAAFQTDRATIGVIIAALTRQGLVASAPAIIGGRKVVAYTLVPQPEPKRKRRARRGGRGA